MLSLDCTLQVCTHETRRGHTVLIQAHTFLPLKLQYAITAAWPLICGTSWKSGGLCCEQSESPDRQAQPEAVRLEYPRTGNLCTIPNPQGINIITITMTRTWLFDLSQPIIRQADTCYCPTKAYSTNLGSRCKEARHSQHLATPSLAVVIESPST